MNWRDLIVDHITGRVREAKIWSNICKLAMTAMFIWQNLHGSASEWLWTVYGASLLGHETYTRMLNQKERNANTSSPESSRVA